MSVAPSDEVGVIVTACSLTKDYLEFLECLATFFSQHNVPAVLIIECSTAAEAATANTKLLPVCTSSTTHISLTQPLNTHTAVSAAISLLNLPLPHVAVIKLNDKDDGTSSGFLNTTNAASVNLQGCHVLEFSPENPLPLLENLFSQVVLHIALVIKHANSSLVCIGYLMKKSRQKALTAQGMLPFLPVNGTFFLPLDLQSVAPMIESISEVVDVLLHKATDFFEIKQTDMVENTDETNNKFANIAATATAVSSTGSVPQYRPELHFILEKLHSSGCCIVDPLETLEIVIDRVQMARALDTACKAARKLALPVRTPAWHLIDQSFSPEILRTASSVSKISLPCVLKPQVACGVEESHQMAFILHPSGLHSDLEVPLPAVLQEYVDHKSIVWKVYVAGNQVFSVQKRSTPDLQPLRDFLALHLSNSGSGVVLGEGDEEDEEDLDIPTSIEFNSLESLPVSLPWLSRLIDPEAVEAAAAKAAPPPPPAGVMHHRFLNQLANVFRKHLGLTLFGFDVVFDYAAGEAVVLDLNFFPSFRGISEAPAALRTAILEKYKLHQQEINSRARAAAAV